MNKIIREGSTGHVGSLDRELINRIVLGDQLRGHTNEHFSQGETKFNRTKVETGVGECRFTDVVVGDYLVYVIFFATIAAPTLLIVYCYVSIYRRIRKEEKQVCA